MSRDKDKLVRQLSLLSFLLSQPRPFTAREIQDSVEGYWDMSDETFARRFHGDRTDLAKVGIEIHASSPGENADTQAYFLSEEEYRLPSVDFTPAERRSLAVALAALDGRFAYARPLRLALTAISQGQPDPVHGELDQLPVVLAPDEDARQAGKQLAHLEDAASRRKTVCFKYPADDGTEMERCLDPYNLFLIQGHWYVVGWDHMRESIRTFRVTRISGTVRFLTEKARDFTVREDYDQERYRARPPWLVGRHAGDAIVKVDEELAWWVSRLHPHVDLVSEDGEGNCCFSIPYADADMLLSWAVGMGDRSELIHPPVLRSKLAESLAAVVEAHSGEPEQVKMPAPSGRPRGKRDGGERIEPPIPAEHLARTISLMQYLADERRPELIPWETIQVDLALSRAEIEHDLSLINLVNFGGGTYALYACADDGGVNVTRDMMADTFAHPARLSPLMTRALLLALDLLGETIKVDDIESLASVRDKIRFLAGALPGESGVVVVDDFRNPSSDLIDLLNKAIREHKVVELDYFTPTRGSLIARQVEPYLLFRSQDAWYLEAFCLHARAQRTFRLEYIRQAMPTAETFAPRAEIDLTSRMSGVAFPAGGSVSWATVRFAPRWRRSLEDRGIRYQSLPDGGLLGSIPYLDERWIVKEVIRYLGDAVLLKPESARRTVCDLAASLGEIYTGKRDS